MAEGSRGSGLNVAILGHSHDGKTTLAEALLFAAGGTPRLGSTDQGTAVLDYEPEEQRRHISIQLALGFLQWRGRQVVLLDTPGFQDFEGEVRQALSVAGSALIAVAATCGGQLPVGAESAWDLVSERGLPRLVVVTKLDKEHADFDSTYQALRRGLEPRPIALQLPIGQEHAFTGSVDLLTGKALHFDERGGQREEDCPQEMQEAVRKARQELVEAVAETDDALLERYLEGDEPSQEQLLQALGAATASGRLAPVLVAAGARALGAGAVLDALCSCLTVPASAASAGAPSLFVFKTVADPFGKISYFQVRQGTLRGDAHLANLRTGTEERIARLSRPRGKTLEPVDSLGPGEIGAATKLLHVATGDSLGPKGSEVPAAVEFPPTSFTMAISPKAKGDEEKIHSGLAHILEEDPTLRLERQAVTHETLLHGLGDVHLEVALEKLKRKYQVEATLATPRVPYQEAIRGTARQQHKYRKQSGGAGLYGDCTIEIEPLPRGEGYQWEDKIFGGAIPHQFRPSVEKGVRQALEQGVLAGYPLVDIRVRLVDGSTHSVDGKDIAFQLAGAMALREAAGKAGVYLLEPVMEVEVIVPAAAMGDVIGHLNSRRGRIGGMNPVGSGLEQVAAQVPLAEMYHFPIELRAMTQGRGRYTMAFSRYEEVPAQVAQGVIATHRESSRGREPASA